MFFKPNIISDTMVNYGSVLYNIGPWTFKGKLPGLYYRTYYDRNLRIFIIS